MDFTKLLSNFGGSGGGGSAPKSAANSNVATGGHVTTVNDFTALIPWAIGGFAVVAVVIGLIFLVKK